MIQKAKLSRKEILERHRAKRRKGLDAINLLGNGGYEALSTLAHKIAYGPGCLPDAPCRELAKQTLYLLGKNRGRLCGRWPDAALADMQKMWEKGDHVDNIAHVFECTRNAVWQLSRKHSWSSRSRREWSKEDTELAHEMWEDGVLTRVIAEKIGRSPDAVGQKARYDGWSNRLPGQGSRIPIRSVHRARRLREKGWSWTRIGKALNRSRTGVRVAVQDYEAKKAAEANL